MITEEKNILDFLDNERIFSVGLSHDKTKAIFIEECDCNFEAELSKTHMKQLIKELEAIEEEMKWMMK